MTLAISEWFGMRKIPLQISGDYSLETLFRQIRSLDFGSAGTPVLTRHRNRQIIAFPEILPCYQVCIMQGGQGGFFVRSGSPLAKVKAMPDTSTHSESNPKQRCLADCEHIAETIKSLKL